MAQALFADHPIEEYLRESGELPELLLPGGIYDFVKELDIEEYGKPIENALLRSFVNYLSKTSGTLCHYVSLDRPSQSQQFAERFKYLIISSSLLSTSLPSAHSAYLTETTPGHYPSVSPSPSPLSLTSTINIFIPIPTQTFTFVILCLIPIFLALGYYAITLFALLVARFLAIEQAPSEESWSSTLEILDALVQSNSNWENTIVESLKLLENEEPSTLYSSVSPLSALRQTFFEALHAIQTQCDDVRHLLAAISFPEATAQLTPMYAPPSPSRLEPQFGFPIPNRRPLSLVASSDSSLPVPLSDYNRTRTSSQPSHSNKRATWSAPSYSSIHPINSAKRESAFLTMNGYQIEPPIVNYSASAPATPSLNSKDDFPFYSEGEEPFGVTALNIRRRSRIPSFGPPTRSSLTGLVGSRFTSLMSSSSQEKSDHKVAIQTTLATRRYTCSHLLALRFPGLGSETPVSTLEHLDTSSDEGYWEDVRSIIRLLTNVLQNATDKLNDILEQQHRSNLADDSHVENEKEDSVPSVRPITHQSGSETLSFAPMPSQFSRFAAHIDAISSALEEARSNLRQCVESLAEGGEDLTSVSEEALQISATKSGAIHSYEELRRALGHALRECERGREPLRSLLGEERRSTVDQVAENESSLAKVVETEMEHQDEQLGSDDSDKTLYTIEDHCSEPTDENQKVEDDAITHLLYTADFQYPPLSGIEQVFETDSAPINFDRPRSKLTREERVALVKAQRKEGIKDHVNVPNKHSMRLGPGDEVVEELKDVIWKVSEQRRQMSLSHTSISTFPSEPSTSNPNQ